ncbi:hypothetical protein ABZX40_32460 [Streptomyces sp. NPDC004610]|uniref:hypothetical protein n=1 Tax=unclassified Streptomyces TaxID=2593676 RepID=UPI0033AA04BB
MTYDLAVWEGERPADDKAAGDTFAALYDHYIDTVDDIDHPPTDRIAAYVAALLDRWGDMDDDNDDTCPWSAGPLIDTATGPLVYFPMRWSMAEETSAHAAELAQSMDLVCFDPQRDRLRPAQDG